MHSVNSTETQFQSQPHRNNNSPSQNNQRIACSVNDACELMGIGRTLAYELIASQKLKTVKIGTRRLVLLKSIHALLDSAE